MPTKISSGARSASITAAANRGQPFDLALIDQDMPGLDGLEVLRRARLRFERTPPYIILLTSHSQVRDRVRGMMFEPRATTPEELSAMLRAELARWSRVVKLAGARPD